MTGVDLETASPARRLKSESPWTFGTNTEFCWKYLGGKRHGHWTVQTHHFACCGVLEADQAAFVARHRQGQARGSISAVASCSDSSTEIGHLRPLVPRPSDHCVSRWFCFVSGCRLLIYDDGS